MICRWLVVWNIFCPYIGKKLGTIIPTDELIFSRGVETSTTNQVWDAMYIIVYLNFAEDHGDQILTSPNDMAMPGDSIPTCGGEVSLATQDHHLTDDSHSRT